jgi:anti-sigma B factor antagonist
MQLAVERAGDVAIVLLPVDELDAGNSLEFKRDIAPVLEANAKVALDLSRLRFIDSSGLGSILSCLRKLNAKGGDLKLFQVSRGVRTIIELVRMHRMMDILDTRDAAVHAFNRT